MGCHSSRNNHLEPTSKLHELTKTHEAGNLDGYVTDPCIVDTNFINRTIENLKQFFGENLVIFVNETMADSGDCKIAKLIELGYDKNPFISPAPTLDKLIANPVLPGGYTLYVVQKELRKAYVYQTKKPDGTMICISPCLEPTNKNGETIPCKTIPFPKSCEVPSDIFLWNQVGPDEDYKIYKEQTDKDKTEIYWKFTGPGKIVTFSKDLAQSLSAKLDFTPQDKLLEVDNFTVVTDYFIV